jgi:hypothetical protein
MTITPFFAAVAEANGLMDGGYGQRTNDEMTLASAGPSQPRRSQLTNGRIV